MMDIVERLRYPHTTLTNEFLNEAAYEIERNRAAIAELVGALKVALKEMENDWHWIDSETGPCGLTLDEAVDAGLAKSIKEARAAITKHTQTTTKGSN